MLDTCAVAYKLQQLGDELTGCSDDDKAKVTNRIFETIRLTSTIEWVRKCGGNVSQYIQELEDFLGINCTCSITDGTPIFNNSPNKDFVIQGCNVSKTTVGLTDTYTINNYTFRVTANAAQNIVTITSPQLSSCEYSQQINVDLDNLYAAVKAKVVNLTEWQFWANNIKKAYTPTNDQLACMGLTLGQWNALNYADSQALIWNKICGCCSTCNAVVSNLTEVKQGANILLDWDNNVGVASVDIYLNNIFVSTVLAPLSDYLLLGAANGNDNTVKLISKCADGSIGNSISITFAESGCPVIPAPIGVSSPPLVDYTCPFDLTALLTLPPPVGLTYEWHNANNTMPISVVANPTAVVNGNYFVFLKDVNGCYSLPVQIIVDCRDGASCSAPQNVSAVKKFADIVVSFDSAAFPPPANSYTVKRRKQSDPDVGGSYTTIGTPTFNVGLGRWTIADSSYSNNVLYVYRAISNCVGGGLYQDYQYAWIPCPVVTLTQHTTSVDYSVIPNNGDVSQIIIEIWDNAETTLIDSDTYVPVFTNPTTGTFTGLITATTYKIREIIKIGTYTKTCSFETITTL
jgi:hypothetical protein